MEDELKGLEKGMKWRGALTGVIAVGWIAFVVLWLLVYAGDYDVYKNIAVALGTLVFAVVVVMITWMSAFAKYMKYCGEAMKGVKGLSWRFGLSLALIVGTVVTVLVWLWFFATDYNGYQNLGILILVVLAALGALGLTWATFDPAKAFGIEGDVDMKGMCAEMMKGVEGFPTEDGQFHCPLTE